ncbi:MAG: hypothetical protein GY710_26905 [Desulfobacteraceae bacterium]|nr:hypothetical protein [Desulfobacteraceae bacterium]
MDDAGFALPSQQIAATKEAQNGGSNLFQTNDESLVDQLLEYLKTQSGDLDITA